MPNTMVGIPTRINETKVFQQLIFSNSDLVNTEAHHEHLTNHNFLPVADLLETPTPPFLSTNCGKGQKQYFILHR